MLIIAKMKKDDGIEAVNLFLFLFLFIYQKSLECIDFDSSLFTFRVIIIIILSFTSAKSTAKYLFESLSVLDINVIRLSEETGNKETWEFFSEDFNEYYFCQRLYLHNCVCGGGGSI